MEYSFTRHVTIGGEDKKEAIEFAYSKTGQEVIGLALQIAIDVYEIQENDAYSTIRLSRREGIEELANMKYLLKYVFPRDNKKENK